MIDRSRGIEALALGLLALLAAPVAAQARQAPANPPSALPKAGANATANPERSGSPFKPNSAAMLRQSNRLKAQGFSSATWNDGQLVMALNSSMTKLNRIDREYQGHRSEAVREIGLAIRQIHSKAGQSGAASITPPKAAASKARMPQDEADTLLREAQDSLVDIEAHMATGGNVKRLAPARATVKKAIEQLKFALTNG